MRIWLNPDEIAERELTAAEVLEAVRGQNVQVAAGQIGGPPYDNGVQVQLPINVKGRLQSTEDFAQIIVKRDEDGTVVRLGDLARLELGAQEYALRSLLDNKPAVAIPIFASPGANALDISSGVRETMAVSSGEVTFYTVVSGRTFHFSRNLLYFWHYLPILSR